MPAELSTLTAALEQIAPLELAEEWDNVGLLVEAPTRTPVARCLLTIDLTERVLAAAIAGGATLIVAYHPPIFAPLRRLRLDDAKQRTVLRTIEAGISIYSPHTALDAAPGGVNDWLCDAFGDGQRAAIPADEDGHGIGRRIELATPLSIEDCVGRVKRHLGLDHVRVAACAAHDGGTDILTVALCAGAGGSVLEGQTADLWLTGELRHHSILAALDRGTSVIVCDHTNTERGYLRVLQERLEAGGFDVEFVIAEDDSEPLRVV